MSSHISAKERQKETKSSAWTFLILGAIGFVVIGLAIIGIIHLPFASFSLFVMEGMFIIFLIIGIKSFISAMHMLDEIGAEDTLNEKVDKWAADHLNAEELAMFADEDAAEEVRYLQIAEEIRRRIMNDNPEVGETYADELAEKYYNQLFH